MADTWNDADLGIRNGQFSPVVEGGFVHVDGETHILNYDTNVLSLDQNRQDTEITTAVGGDDEEPPQSSYYDSEEEEDVEVLIIQDIQCFSCFSQSQLIIIP